MELKPREYTTNGWFSDFENLRITPVLILVLEFHQRHRKGMLTVEDTIHNLQIS